ncbi:histidinol dehydrogenase [Bacteroidota bacterium]
MNIYKYPEPSSWIEMLKRPAYDTTSLYEKVESILADVKKNGDAAVIKYTKQFDKADIQEFRVKPADLHEANSEVSEELKEAIKEAEHNIKKFHSKQLNPDIYEETTPGVRCWQKTVPIQKVGLYIPGGSAPLLSTVLMLGVPAQLAGCKEIVLCTPPDENGNISAGIKYIAHLLGIDKVFSVGGVQAIAAMAYGTESIPKVNKIYGPGNQYVTAAKQLVSRDTVAIDMPAGPSELAVIADDSCVPAYVASDLLSQAEHGIDSQVILISNSERLIQSVQKELESQMAMLPRKEIAAKSLKNSKIILMESRSEMVDIVNYYAPEHLIIVCKDYAELSEQIENVGSIFLGNYTPESAGDYASGTNHTLPTNGWAHSYGGLNMDAFVKKITLQEISKDGLFNIGRTVMTMAEEEKLLAHKNSVAIRMKN